MRFETLQLVNVGVFGGEQTIDLRAENRRRPLILIGGLNGCGKTTILESILLVFYGKLSPAVRESKFSYKQYLQELMTRGDADESTVELSFRHRDDRGNCLYRITRTWIRTNQGIKDEFAASVDGCYDQLLSEHWEESVDQFLPIRLAGLFFFDAERIESLANPEQAPSLISSAINSLLGADIVEQLGADLAILERRRRKSMKPLPDQDRIEELEDKLQSLTQKRSTCLQDQAACVDPLARSRHRLDQAEEAFREQGGNVASAHEVNKRELATVENQISSILDQMRTLAAGPLPLSLLRTDLTRILETAAKGLKVDDNKRIYAILETRDQTVLKKLSEVGVPKKAIAEVTAILREDRAARESDAEGEFSLAIGRQAIQQIADLLDHQFQDDLGKAKVLLAELDTLNEKQVELDRVLSATPDEDTIQPLFNAMGDAQKEVLDLESKQRSAAASLEDVERDIRVVEKELNQRLRDTGLSKVHDSDNHRFIEHSQRARATLASFREALIQRHLSRLETLIFNGFQSILRKASLVKTIRINPKTCELNLLNAQDEAVPADRLSAGERQLLATAILWGLARASGRPLPVIIDTPIGRLDSTHRENIVKHYIPQASHQVFILSTDEEIVGEHHKALSPYIAREYVLEHDDLLNRTVIREGYFSTELAHAD